MLRLRYFLILFFITIIHTISKAADGCLLPNNIVYTSGTLINILGFETFQRGGGKATLSINYCSWTPVTGSKCYVCATVTGLACTDTATEGIRSNNFQMVQCNLDDYSLPLIAATGILGLIVIRKHNKK